MAQEEKLIEASLIEQLATGESQWTHRKDIHTEEALWNNIIEKLVNSNKGKIQPEKHPLTKDEIFQIKEYIKTQAETPYKAAQWLSGENGLVQIPLKREDANLGEIFLDAIDNRDVKSGNTSYEIINQYVSFKEDDSDTTTRFDVTLLINGFPLIHIELKNEDHPYMDAFRQIRRYMENGKFTGVFGLVQMFVVSNGVDTKYFAATTCSKLNENFLASWVDVNNKPVRDYLGFAKAALNIPQAHYMVSRYRILDDNSQSIILLRPYQIHAIEAVKEASRRKESGFIWHTTGSGKTITSFNVTKNLLEKNLSIDKAIFLIDRKDLDQQTTISFQSYAKTTGDSIEETENTKALENCLKSKDRIVIVATRQKLDCLLDKCEKAIESGNENAYYYKVAKKLKDKHIAFVVDECHRAISSQAKIRIEKFFDNSMKKSLWYGFTGTPIFAENKKAELGKAARTTELQYGNCLHQYTIKEALHDHAVLGFKVHNAGFAIDELQDIAIDKLEIAPEAEILKMDRHILESKVLQKFKEKTNKNFYDNEKHREKVIDYIVNRSNNHFRLDLGKGNAFEAILTCQSIEIAQKYYSEFKKFIAEGKVKNSIKRRCDDFPKIAITYSVGDNDESALVNQKMMKEALADYNKLFKTNWSIDNINAYNTDLNSRLARKKGIYQRREEQLDLVIVVDRLLTGFDAPCLSTLFIDRPPMSPQNLIQAFSRTNRIFNDKKIYGDIITFQCPETFKNAYENALRLYSNGGGGYVQAPSYEESKRKFLEAVAKLNDFRKDIDNIDMKNHNQLKAYVKAYQNFDKALAALRTYEEWENECNKIEEDIETKASESNNTQELSETTFDDDKINQQALNNLTGTDISQSDLDKLSGIYKNAVEELKKDKNTDTKDIDIEYHLESVNQQTVDYDYLVSLIQKYISAGSSAFDKINDPTIDKYIDTIEAKNPKLGEIIRGIWEELKANPKEFEGKQAIILINEKINNLIDTKIQQFCKEWCVSKADMEYLSKYYVAENELVLQSNYEEYLNNGVTLSKLKYNKNIRILAKELIENEILPLRRR